MNDGNEDAHSRSLMHIRGANNQPKQDTDFQLHSARSYSRSSDRIYEDHPDEEDK